MNSDVPESSSGDPDSPAKAPPRIYYHPDALEKLYLPQVDSMPIINLTVERSLPILITSLQETDLQNELAQRHGLGEISREELEGVRLQLHKDKVRGKISSMNCDWEAVLSLAREYTLTAAYTRSWPLREILHLAAARHLGFDAFLTPDLKLRELAGVLGFQIP